MNQTIDSSNPYTAKLNRIRFGGLTMELNPINQNLEISSIGSSKRYFINSETGHSNVNIDLENKTISNLKILNLESDTISVQKLIHPETSKRIDQLTDQIKILQIQKADEVELEPIKLLINLLQQQISNLNTGFADNISEQIEILTIQKVDQAQIYYIDMILNLHNDLIQMLQIDKMDLARFSHEKHFILQYIDDRIISVPSFDPTSINLRIDSLAETKEDCGAYDSAVLGLSISVGVLQVQALAMDVFIGMASSAAAAAAAVGAANTTAIALVQTQVVALEATEGALVGDLAATNAVVATTVASTVANKVFISSTLGFAAATAFDLIGLQVQMTEKASLTDFSVMHELVGLIDTDLGKIQDVLDVTPKDYALLNKNLVSEQKITVAKLEAGFGDFDQLQVNGLDITDQAATVKALLASDQTQNAHISDLQSVTSVAQQQFNFFAGWSTQGNLKISYVNSVGSYQSKTLYDAMQQLDNNSQTIVAMNRQIQIQNSVIEEQNRNIKALQRNVIILQQQVEALLKK